MHVTIDGFGGNPAQLANEPLVRELLDRYPGEIGMTKISEPHVFEYHGDKPGDWGVSGFVLIAESHIAIHTFPDRGYVWVDIFSCKAFEADGAIDRIVEEFRLSEAKVRTLARGLEYPHSVAEAEPIAVSERLVVAGAVGAGESY